MTTNTTPSILPADNMHNMMFEQAIIASILVIDGAFDQLPAGFDAKAFFNDAHRQIFNAARDVLETGKTIDTVLVIARLNEKKVLSASGGEAYVKKIISDNKPTLYHLPVYAEKLMDLAARRHAESLLKNSLATLQAQPETPAADLIAGTLTGLLETFEGAGKNLPDTTLELGKRFIHRLENPQTKRSYDTGFMQLNNVLSGLFPEQLIIIAGTPGTGKTSLGLNVLDGVMAHSNLQTLMFSMEMDADSLMDRYVASLASVPLTCIRNGWLNDEQQAKSLKALQDILTLRNITIDPREARTPMDLLVYSRQMQRKKGKIGAILVDYLQLMRYPKYSNDRTQEVAEISKGLKSMAKQLKCPVIALSQLNRESSKTNRRPVMSDLKESSQIEQDADVILFLYREKPKDGADNNNGLTELIIAKNRNGPLGTIKLAFQGQYTRYLEATPDTLMGLDP